MVLVYPSLTCELAKQFSVHGERLLTILKVAVIIANALTKIDVAGLSVAFAIEEGSPENRDLTVALDAELNILG